MGVYLKSIFIKQNYKEENIFFFYQKKQQNFTIIHMN